MMNISTGIVGAFGFLGITTAMLKVLFYLSAIIVSFKAVQALNIYINKNTR